MSKNGMRLPLASISPFDLFKNFETNFIIHLPDQNAANIPEVTTIPVFRNLADSLNKVAEGKENDYYYLKKYEEYRNSRKVEDPLRKNYSFHAPGCNVGRTKENERSFMNINCNMNINNDNQMSYYLRRNINKNDNGRNKTNITTVTECEDTYNTRMLSFHEKKPIREENRKDRTKIDRKNNYDQNYFKELVENHPNNCCCMNCKVFKAITTSKQSAAGMEKRRPATQLFEEGLNEMEFEKPVQSIASFIEGKQNESGRNNKLNGIKHEIHSLIDIGFKKKLFFKREAFGNETKKESRYERVVVDESNQIANDGAKRSISTYAIPNIIF